VLRPKGRVIHLVANCNIFLFSYLWYNKTVRMASAILKYNKLPALEKKEVSDFIDFLFNRSKKENTPDPEDSDYKRDLLTVSVWSEEDLKVFEENSKYFKQWAPPTW